MSDATLYFFNANHPLSNFYHVKDGFVLDGHTFAISEAAFMYRKAKFFGDEDAAAELVKVGNNPKKAKAIGRRVKEFDEAQWAAARADQMLEVVSAKFEVPTLRQYLINTSPKWLVEASPYDRLWGIGISVADAERGVAWKGENLLGNVLMQLRARLLNEAAASDTEQ